MCPRPTPPLTKEERVAYNLEVYKKLAFDRGMHLFFIYVTIFGITIGCLITFYFR